MSETTTVNLDQLKKTYEQFRFIHQVLTQRTQYFLDEVDVAKDAARVITEMANKLSDDIQAQLPPKEEIKTEEEATVNEQI